MPNGSNQPEFAFVGEPRGCRRYGMNEKWMPGGYPAYCGWPTRHRTLHGEVGQNVSALRLRTRRHLLQRAAMLFRFSL